MTMEHVQILDLAELQIVRLTCGSCRTVLSIPVVRLTANVPIQCSTCGHIWETQHEAAQSAVYQFVNGLKNVQAQLRPGGSLQIQIELRAPDQP